MPMEGVFSTSKVVLRSFFTCAPFIKRDLFGRGVSLTSGASLLVFSGASVRAAGLAWRTTFLLPKPSDLLWECWSPDMIVDG